MPTDFDTVVMNPPFGTRNTGIDTAFVMKGMEYSNVVYSLHKTSTREVGAVFCFPAKDDDPALSYFEVHICQSAKHYMPSTSSIFIANISHSFRAPVLRHPKHFVRLAAEHDLHFEVLAELKYDIPKTFKHQKMKSKDVFVDLYRFTHKS
jgi:predicted RNA methylase